MKQAFRWRVRSEVMTRITGITFDGGRVGSSTRPGISTEGAQEMQKGIASKTNRENQSSGDNID
jgi:hypothetical protein